MEKQKAVAVTEENVADFLRVKNSEENREIWVPMAGIGAVVLIFLLVCGNDTFQSLVNGYRGLLWSAAMIGAVVCGVCAPNPFRMLNVPGCRLLQSWERVTGYSASQFPVSAEQKAFLASWAAEKLKELAANATGRFTRQAEIRGNAKTFLIDRKLDPEAVATAMASMDEVVSDADWKAKEAQRSYLDFWDLVTEQGVGILTGPDWSDPEVFRKSVAESQTVVTSDRHF